MKTLTWLLFSDLVGWEKVRYALNLMVSDSVLLYAVPSTSSLIERGVTSVGSQAHAAVGPGAGAMIGPKAGAGAGAGGKKGLGEGGIPLPNIGEYV